jgi:SAM-dependent methyltransferase
MYDSYDEYLKHQSSKVDSNKKLIETINQPEYLSGFIQEFELFKKFLIGKKKAICMGARNGAEVIAMRKFISDTIGIDIHPICHSSIVIKGDFNKTPFAKNLFDVVYMNCLDHSINLMTTLGEIHRILKVNGIFISRLPIRNVEPHKKKTFEACFWGNSSEVYDYIRRYLKTQTIIESDNFLKHTTIIISKKER